MSLAAGDQILVTRFVFDNARSVLRGGEIGGVGPLSWMNHGPYRLAGVEEPIEVCEVGETNLAPLSAPVDSDKAHRHLSADGEPVLGWRPALAQRVPGTGWTLESKLGEGGFGEVWLAVRPSSTNGASSSSASSRAGPLPEARRRPFPPAQGACGRAPNIARMREAISTSRRSTSSWITRKGRICARGARPTAEPTTSRSSIRLEIAAQVADGLHAAHEAGVLHRDVKPTNILVSTPSASAQPPVLVKLTDFGIGQVISQEALAGMTQQGGFTQTMFSGGSSSPQSGTQLYMAPELLAGEGASVRSDIYSLGIVLYQLVVGDFGRPLTMDWARRVADPLLREDLERCFAGNPDERFASASDLARSLRSLDDRRSAARRKRLTRRLAASAAGVAALAVLFFVAWRLPLSRESTAPPPPKTIAVVPFRDDNAAPADEYRSDSLTSELVGAIRKVPGLNAVRPPAFLLERPPDELRVLLAQMNWPFLLDGTIQETAGSIRIVGRLRSTVDDREFFSEVYERRAGDFLGIPNDLALRVADQTGVPPLSAATRDQVARTPTRNSEAYDYDLRGRFYLDLVNPGYDDRSVALLKHAVELDPNYAVAYADLTRAYVRYYFYYKPEDAPQIEQRASDALRRAFELDPDLPEAHFAAAYYAWTPSQGWQHAKAIEAYRSALRANPYWEEASEQLALVYVHVGLLEEARALVAQALVNNPLNFRAESLRANALLWEGKNEDAVELWRKIPADKRKLLFFIHQTYYATALINLGRLDEAASLIDDGLKTSSQITGGLWSSVQALWYARRGNERAARENIARVFERRGRFGHFHHAQYNVAATYALLNRPAEAMRYLRDAAADGFPCYPLFAADRNLDNLRDDPDFTAFLDEQKKYYDDIRARFALE